MEYITVRVKFPTGAATYDYAAPKNFGICVGDQVLVDSMSGKTWTTVAEVLQSVTSKTTRGIIGHMRDCSAVDKFFKERQVQRQQALVEVNKILEKQKYAVAAAADPVLGAKLKELGLL